MPVTILCPLSKNPIQEPVVYKGYIYDKSSLEALAALKKAPTDLTQENIKALAIDHFTQSLLEFSKLPDHDLVPITEYNKFTENEEGSSLLDNIYNDPISICFPKTGILCAADGRVYGKGEIERLFKKRKLRPFISPTNRAPLSITEDFLVHPIYQHLLNSLAEAKRNGETEVSLSAIFNNFNQAEAERIYFDQEQLTAEPAPRKNNFLNDDSPLWVIASILSSIALSLLTILPNVLAGGWFLILSSPPATLAIGVMMGALIIRNELFDTAQTILGLYNWTKKFPLLNSLLPALGIVATAALIVTLIFAGGLIGVSLGIAIISMVATLQLFISSSFFDKATQFNLNKTNQQIRIGGALSLTLSLALTAALSAGILITLGSFSLAPTAVIFYALPIIPLIFNSLYRNIYTLRCSDFFTQIFSGQINASLFKKIFAHDMVYKIIFISTLSFLCVCTFPLFGPLGTCAIGLAAFSIGINLTGFQRKFFQLQEGKESAQAKAQLMATLSATPLTKVEIEESLRPTFINKVDDLRRAQQSSASRSATTEASEIGAESSHATTKAGARAAAMASFATNQRKLLSRSSASLFAAADADTAVTPLLATTAGGAVAGAGTGLLESEEEEEVVGKGYGTFGS